jgi:hypothetical protein
MTHTRLVKPAALPLEDRREILDRLRQLAAHAEAADALERRADRTDNDMLVTLLRGRAAERREMAERLRVELAAQGVVPFPRSGGPA